MKTKRKKKPTFTTSEGLEFVHAATPNYPGDVTTIEATQLIEVVQLVGRMLSDLLRLAKKQGLIN